MIILHTSSHPLWLTHPPCRLCNCPTKQKFIQNCLLAFWVIGSSNWCYFPSVVSFRAALPLLRQLSAWARRLKMRLYFSVNERRVYLTLTNFYCSDLWSLIADWHCGLDRAVFLCGVCVKNDISENDCSAGVARRPQCCLAQFQHSLAFPRNSLHPEGSQIQVQEQA